jgi:hypothetical protein
MATVNDAANRVRETCTSPGTGTVTLLGVPSPNAGWQAFTQAFATGSTVYYGISDQSGNNWEEGIGTFTTSGTTLARTAANVINGSAGPGVLVNFSSGTQDVICTLPREQIPFATYPLNARVDGNAGSPDYMADLTAITLLSLDNYKGDQIAVYNGAFWQKQTVVPPGAGSPSLWITDTTQTGTWSNAAKTVSGLLGTSGLVVGMQVTGTNIAANSVIASINSATQVTLNNTPTGSGSAAAITFKCPPSTAYYLYAVINGTGVTLRFGNAGLTEGLTWQNGVRVNGARIGGASDSNLIATSTGRLVGLVVTTQNAGQTEDSVANRLLANYENRIDKTVESIDNTLRSTVLTTYTQVGAVQVNYVTFGDNWVTMEGITMGYTQNAAYYTTLAIGSGPTTFATGCRPAGCYGTALVASTITKLREAAAAGIVTRYLIFKNAATTTACYADGAYDSSGNYFTSLSAQVKC